MKSIIGFNLDQGNVFSERYCQELTAINGNHIRLFPWSGFSTLNSAHLAQLSSYLDIAYANGIMVTLCLTLREWAQRSFIGGYPSPSSTPPVVGDIELTKADFLRLYTAIGNHPAIHSWDLHNEPFSSDWNPTVTDPNQSAKQWTIETFDYIKSLDVTRPISEGVTQIKDPGKDMVISDCAEILDLISFHYYVTQGTTGSTFWDSATISDAILNGTITRPHVKLADHIDVIRKYNLRNLPVWIDECGIPTEPSSSGYAYTDFAGQNTYYETLLSEIVANYPEIQGINFWQGNINSRYSVWNIDWTLKPAATTIANYYKTFAKTPLPFRDDFEDLTRWIAINGTWTVL